MSDDGGPETQAFDGGSADRYERISRIATGGMGEVWRARDTVLGREVAVKVLKQEYADDPTFRARFDAEARHAAGLHHPGIAAVFDYGAHEGEAPYLVMELVDGRPLNELIAGDRAIDPEQARLLALQVAEALAVAHQAGVVHRDVKPANLLVTPDGRVKITDFGIARATDSVPYTQTGQIVGTPHYLSPEQARGETATAASDVYALGVVLFECLNGTRPFVADSPIATALAHIRDEVPPLPDHVPPALASVVRRALEKDPGKRFADGAAMATALREAGAHPEAVAPPPAATEVISAVPPTAAVDPVAAAAPPPSPVVTETTTAERPSRWPLYVAAALALVVVLALLVAHPWTDSSDGTSSDEDTVSVRAADYVGEPVGKVKDALEAKGLKTTTHEVDNSGDHKAGRVADLSPTGEVAVGSRITLDVWSKPSSGSSDQSDQSDSSDGPGDGQSDKPEKTKAPKPEKSSPAQPNPPEPSDNPGNGGGTTPGDTGGDTGGTSNGLGGAGASLAPAGRDSAAAEPGTGTKGD